MTAAAAPKIISQPSDDTAITQETATFAVTATGISPLSYQWRKNGMDIHGATAADYTTPAVSAQDSGALFSVVVSNSADRAISQPAKLTVQANTTTATRF